MARNRPRGTIVFDMQDYRKLRVWRKAVALAISVRRAVGRYPSRGFADLKDQTIRAAESIHHNIVEGCGAPTQKDFARFLGNAIKSSSELEGALHLAFAYEILPGRDWEHLGEETADTRKMLHGLRTVVLYGEDSVLDSEMMESLGDAVTDNGSPETHSETVRNPDASKSKSNRPEEND